MEPCGSDHMRLSSWNNKRFCSTAPGNPAVRMRSSCGSRTCRFRASIAPRSAFARPRPHRGRAARPPSGKRPTTALHVEFRPARWSPSCPGPRRRVRFAPGDRRRARRTFRARSLRRRFHAPGRSARTTSGCHATRERWAVLGRRIRRASRAVMRRCAASSADARRAAASSESGRRATRALHAAKRTRARTPLRERQRVRNIQRAHRHRGAARAAQAPRAGARFHPGRSRTIPKWVRRRTT